MWWLWSSNWLGMYDGLLGSPNNEWYPGSSGVVAKPIENYF